MTRVQFNRPVASPTLSATAGQILDLDDDEAQRRIAAGHCTPLDQPSGRGRLIDRLRRALTPDPPQDKTLDKLTVEQLRAYAAGHGIDLGDAAKKADIRAVIEAAQEGWQDKPLDAMSVEELRAYADEHDVSLPEDGEAAALAAVIEAELQDRA